MKEMIARKPCGFPSTKHDDVNMCEVSNLHGVRGERKSKAVSLREKAYAQQWDTYRFAVDEIKKTAIY